MQFGGQGGLLDTFLQAAVPVYGLMRNIKAMEDPAKYGKGTMYGMATNYGKDGFSFGNIGNNLGFPGSDGGWFGGSNNYPSSPYQSGYNISDGGWFGTGIGANVGMNTSIDDDLSYTDPDGGGYTYGGDVSIGGGGYSVDVGDDDVGVASY